MIPKKLLCLMWHCSTEYINEFATDPGTKYGIPDLGQLARQTGVREAVGR